MKIFLFMFWVVNVFMGFPQGVYDDINVLLNLQKVCTSSITCVKKFSLAFLLNRIQQILWLLEIDKFLTFRRVRTTFHLWMVLRNKLAGCAGFRRRMQNIRWELRSIFYSLSLSSWRQIDKSRDKNSKLGGAKLFIQKCVENSIFSIEMLRTTWMIPDPLSSEGQNDQNSKRCESVAFRFMTSLSVIRRVKIIKHFLKLLSRPLRLAETNTRSCIDGFHHVQLISESHRPLCTSFNSSSFNIFFIIIHGMN